MIKIGRLTVSLERREMFVEQVPIKIGERAFEILELLILASGDLVTKAKIFDSVWPNRIVGDNNLQVHVSALRNSMGADKTCLQTVPGKGYRLVIPPSQPGGSSYFGQDDVTVSGSMPNRRMPSFCRPLIGRETAVAETCSALHSSPLVTLVGPGGIGKTWLAMHVAREVTAQFMLEYCVVGLTTLTTPAQILQCIADAFGMQSEAPATLESILEHLRGRELLIVLDNCEHVICEVAKFVENMLTASSKLRVLATSREPLRVTSEQVYFVPPLDVPRDNASCDLIRKSASVQLFLARARAIDSHFRVDNDSVPMLGTICRRLDGVPLALEFAAERAVSLGIRELINELHDPFRVLVGGKRTAPSHQRTMKASLDWSYQLLSETEQIVLRKIGIFVGDFELHDVHKRFAKDGMSREQLSEGIVGLVSKSLLMTSRDSSVKVYHLLEMTRVYVSEIRHDKIRQAASSRHVTDLYDHVAGADEVQHVAKQDCYMC